MKFAVLDIETSNLNADYGFIICAVVKPYEMGEPQVFRIDNYSIWKNQKFNDKYLIRDLTEYLEDYDGIITYNGKRFDIPFIRSRILFWRERHIKRLFHIDVLDIVRYRLKIHNAKLNSLIEFLNSNEEINVEKIEEKVALNNTYYMRAITGDKKGLNYLVEHCIKDVIALEQCYDFLKEQINILRRSV